MTLADARALLPELTVADATPRADAEALGRLADWCTRYSPWPATDGEDGIRLEITGCDHLFGGEASMLADIERRIRGFGVTVRGAIAGNPAAAWGWARYRPKKPPPILGPDETEPLLALPIAALRLDPDSIDTLRVLGIGTVAEVAALPRGPLAQRLGNSVLQRLDRMFGEAAEPISPRRVAEPWISRLIFAEAIGRREDIDAAVERLVAHLCRQMSDRGQGARRLALRFYRVDGSVQPIAIGTSSPSHAPTHIVRLFAERLDAVEPGFGIEAILLEATEAEPLSPSQSAFTAAGEIDAATLSGLIDRLQNRLGPDRVVRLMPVESHVPEKAERQEGASAAAFLPRKYHKSTSPFEREVGNASALTGGGTGTRRFKNHEQHLFGVAQQLIVPKADNAIAADERRNNPQILMLSKRRHCPLPVDARASPPSPSRGEAPRFLVRRKKLAEIFPLKSARPLTLLRIPEPIEAIAPVPDDPPLSFLWRRIRRRVAFADGPERIGPEWWLPAQGKARDYYRVEDMVGRRFWLYREGLYGAPEPPRWFLHGFFP